jgi:hypothetical protein
MPLTSKRRLDPNREYIALDGVSTTVGGRVRTLHRGERVRGDDPVARVLGPSFFDDADEPVEVGGPIEQPPEPEPEAPRPHRLVDDSTPASDLFISTAEILSSPVGPLPPGTIVHRDDLRRQEMPEAFVPVVRKFGAAS